MHLKSQVSIQFNVINIIYHYHNSKMYKNQNYIICHGNKRIFQTNIIISKNNYKEGYFERNLKIVKLL